MENVNVAEEWRSADEKIRALLPPGIKLLHTLRGHTGHIGRIAWSPNGHIIASPSEDKTVRLWEPTSGKCLGVLEGHETMVISVAFDPQGNILGSGGEDGT